MYDFIVAQNEAKFKILLETARQKRAEREAARQAAEAAEQQATLFAAQERYQMALATARAALPEPLRGRIMDSFDPQHNRFNPYEFYVNLGDGAKWFSVRVEMNRGRNDELPAGDYVVTGWHVGRIKWGWDSEDGIAFKVIKEDDYYCPYNTLEEALEVAVAVMDQAVARRAEYRQEYEQAKQRRARLEQEAEIDETPLPEACPPAEWAAEPVLTPRGESFQRCKNRLDLALRCLAEPDADHLQEGQLAALSVIAEALILIAEREV